VQSPGATAPPVSAGDPELPLTRQAQKALERGQRGKAIELARRATQENPGDANAWLTLGAAYDAAGSPGAAKAAYKSCVATAHGANVSECRALAGE
jgi:Flp pilus assembly protein TadD